MPRLLSAHFSRAGSVENREPGELLLVFSAEVDPATLDPAVFVVVLESGDLSYPARALLDPADEVDENRSVTLLGSFGLPTENPPVAVRIVGNLYGEDGSGMSGLDAEIRAFSVPDEVVWMEVLEPGEHRCAGARQVVRTYWTDNLRGVDPEDLNAVRVSFTDGSEVTPTGFDDHAGVGAERVTLDDNVLDLCLARDAPVSAVSVSEAAFTDAAGHASARTTRATSARE
jgi:hypothetical protein